MLPYASETVTARVVGDVAVVQMHVALTKQESLYRSALSMRQYLAIAYRFDKYCEQCTNCSMQ